MDHDQSDVTTAQSAIQLGIVPLSPAAARIAALEAEVARLLAENTVFASNALQANLDIFVEPVAPPAVRPAFPISALGRHAMRIGLISEFH
jgi:uncharacterized small protein (DUF1192 family)